MCLENWILSLTKWKKIALKITDSLLVRVNLESVEDEQGTVGVKAVWVGERGESVVEVNSPSLKGNIKTEGAQAPTVEYWQKGDKRGFAVRNPKSISGEFDEKTLRKLSTPKAAGIAAALGALAGLLGWVVVIVASRATLVKPEAKGSSPPLLKSRGIQK